MPTFETTDLNLATFIKTVKGVNSNKHYLRGRQLVICFPISGDDGRAARLEYINSPFAAYDANKRNYTQVLKELLKEEPILK